MTAESETKVALEENKDDGDDDNELQETTAEEQELSLSEFMFSQLNKVLHDPDAIKHLQPFLCRPDAFCRLNGETSHGELPMGLDWSTFRKAYTLLIWIKPVLTASEDYAPKSLKKRTWHQAPSSSNVMVFGGGEKRRIWYHFSTHHLDEDNNSRTGVCVQSGPWRKKSNSNVLESVLTAFALPPTHSSTMVQVPIRIKADEFSLIGFTHNFPYLKKPQWTVTVNGVLQGRAEVKYPVDTPRQQHQHQSSVLQHAVVLQNLGLGGVEEIAATDESGTDCFKSASELTASLSSLCTANKNKRYGLDFHVASLALHADVIGSELQALMATTGGPSLSLQHGGKIATPLPPVENWTKGSSLEHGPNVGIPLAVHPLSLQLQHSQDKAIHYFGAASAELKGNKRIVWTQTPLPGIFDSTPKVGLIQPALPQQDSSSANNDNTPTLQFKGEVRSCHALPEYLMENSSEDICLNYNPSNSSQQLSIILQEQGLLTFLIMPFFLAQLPTAGHGLNLQKSLQEQSLRFLYSLYTNDGAWGASLIQALADCIQHGGSRVHEQVLQNGLLHILASSLRQSLIRAERLSIHSYATLEEFCSAKNKKNRKEEAWWRPTHDEACPSWIAMPIAHACARLVSVSCGVYGKDTEENEKKSYQTLLMHWQRGSDLALTSIFGLALNLDLWGRQEEALLCMLSEICRRYGNITGGQLLRRQIPIQSFLDLIRSRLEFASPKVGERLAVLLRYMLLASLSHTKNISIGEHDIHACCSALSDLPLGSVGTHVIFNSWSSLLDWCNSTDNSAEDEEHMMNVCKKLGRNLIMSQYHDVIAPMLLSRTVFCGERSMSASITTKSKQSDSSIEDSKEKATPPLQNQPNWQNHWRMVLSLFAWVTSIAGPEGVIAAKAVGSLLLASGAAGSLEGCLIEDDSKTKEYSGKSLSYLHHLFMPPPTMALMMVGMPTSASSNKSLMSSGMSDLWTYADLLSDRLRVMMPLVPGFVMSLISNPNNSSNSSIKAKKKALGLLKDLLEAMGASFHRVLGVMLSSTNAKSPKKQLRRGQPNLSPEQQAIIKAAKDFTSPLVLSAAWIENSLHWAYQREEPATKSAVVFYQATPPSKAEDEWVETAKHTFFSDSHEDDVLDPQLQRQRQLSAEKEESITVLQDCQKCVLSTITDLLCHAMIHGGGGTSTALWRAVVNTLLQDAVIYIGKRDRRATAEEEPKPATASSVATTSETCRSVLCRLVAIVLTKVQRRDHEFELWSPTLCESIARLVDLVEELELLSPSFSYEEDRILLQGAILQILNYGRNITGWCQLILPKPPQPQTTRDFGGGPILTEGGEAWSAGFDTDFQPPGSSTKILLPILQPCLRVAIANMSSWDSHQAIVATLLSSESIVETKLVTYLIEELQATLVAAIVGLSFPNARDAALLGLASIRKSLNSKKTKAESVEEDKVNSENEPTVGDDDDSVMAGSLQKLSLELLEETRARYDGERRRREMALFDAYDDEGQNRNNDNSEASVGATTGANSLLEAQLSISVERVILGNDLVPQVSSQKYGALETEEISFGDDKEASNKEGDKNNDDKIVAENVTKKPTKIVERSSSGADDFVMFHDQVQHDSDGKASGLESMLKDTKTQLGYDQYKGFGATLDECHTLIKSTSKDAGNQHEIVFALLLPYLDTWDANAMLDQSELVGLYSDIYSYNESTKHIEEESTTTATTLNDSVMMIPPRSGSAADAMSTYIEMASVEKARLSEYVNSFLPSHRYSCQAYTERFCWSRYMEITVKLRMDDLWERGIADGNRDIRSRLMTMPCNPQFKRFIPKYLDHSDDADQENEEHNPEAVEEAEIIDDKDNQQQLQARLEEGINIEGDEDTKPTGEMVQSFPPMLGKMKRKSKTIGHASSRAVVDPSQFHTALMESHRELHIVDITKKEQDDEDVADPDLSSKLLLDTDDEDEDIFGDGSLGFPTREHIEHVEDDKKDDNNSSLTSITEDEESTTSSIGITPTRVAAAAAGGAQHHFNIASSIYGHPPDNSSSILSLLHSSASSPALIEKHFDNCLQVKAEGSRKCTMLLSTTHLILEYDSEAEGLFEGELMAVREEAERQRLIEEAGGIIYGGKDGNSESELQDRIREQLERRQKEIAAVRPKSIRWNLSELSHVYLRRYRLRNSAVEMFFIPSGGSSFGGFGLYSPATSLFLDFGTGADGHRKRDEAATAIMRRSPPQTIKQWPDRNTQFLHDQLSRLTMGWVEGRITNFDYLLHLNMLAGRSYNDLCQYPVMPWVLSDYNSEEIPDLTDPTKFRDLSKPVGALNADRMADFMERFQTFADPTIPPFMYGSHYSTSAGVVLHFLVRMHPFAGLHRQLQGGHFDVADRLFSSIPRTWDMCTGFSAAEVKELTPEWYCNPSFLKNSNNFKLGTSQDGEVLGDVILPPWAKGSPEKFVEVMRNALESRICSDMLPDWIDLIFGRKQQGPAAIQAKNVFFYLTYYGSVDVAMIEDEGLRQATELQIAHFGQCPMQLFVRPHVRRAVAITTRKLTFYQMLSAYTTTNVIVVTKMARKGTGPGSSLNTSPVTTTTTQKPWKEVEHLPFFHAPPSHSISLEAPPPGPHANLIAVRLAGIDRCLAVDANGIFHSFRWAWKPQNNNESSNEDIDPNDYPMLVDQGNFVAQRELPRFRTVPRLFYAPSSLQDSTITNHPPAVAISKTLFASRSVLLVLSDGDGRGALAMQLVDPAKGNVKGEAVVPSVHSAQITSISMAPIGTAAGHGGVGGELAIVGSSDGNASLWRFMSSHYLPLRPRMRMRGHHGHKIHAVALNPSIHICATISENECCIFSIGNGALIRSWSPPHQEENALFHNLPSDHNYKTIFCDTPALDISVQGYVVTVCETTIFNTTTKETIRRVITLHLFSLEGVSLGSKALESWRGIPHKLHCTPDGTALTVCSDRGVTIHQLSSIKPLDFLDEWHVPENDDNVDNSPYGNASTAAWDVDFGPSLMRPIVAATACSSGILRLHALPGISAWSERHKKSNHNFVGALTSGQTRFMGRFRPFNKESSVQSIVSDSKNTPIVEPKKGSGVTGFFSGALFRKSKN